MYSRNTHLRIKSRITFLSPAKSAIRPLAVITLVYLVLAISYAVLTPPWETPDEPAHYQYVVQLAERWRPPSDPMIRQRDRFCRDYAYISSNYEWYHPAFGYLPLSVAYKILKAVAPHSLPATLPPFNPFFCSDPFANPNLFHLETSSPIETWRHQWGFLILRIFSSLWGLPVIFAAYRVGQLLGSERLAIVASCWIAFLPQFAFISASVRNDTASNAIGALLFLLIADIMLFPEPTRRKRLIVITGLVLGTGMLTKLTFAYLIPVALLVTIFASPKSNSLIEQTKAALCIIGFSLGVVTLYYLGYSEAQAAFSYTRAQMKITPHSLSVNYWKPFFPMLIDLFFARFGWANILIPGWWIKIAFGIWLSGAFLSIYHAVRLLKYRKNLPEARLTLVFALSLLLALAAVIRYNFSHFQPQGRFLFPALVSWAHLGTWGILKSLPERARRPVSLAIVGYMLLFNLRSLISLSDAYY